MVHTRKKNDLFCPRAACWRYVDFGLLITLSGHPESLAHGWGAAATAWARAFSPVQYGAQ